MNEIEAGHATMGRAPCELSDDFIVPLFDPQREDLLEPRRPPGHNRRLFLKILSSGVLGVGLALTDAFSNLWIRAAYGFTYTWHDFCPSYNASTVCTPSDRYMGSDTCTPNTHWHRDGWRNWTSNGIQYAALYTPMNLCAGRNAWNWSQANGGNAPFGFCSDGWKSRWRLPAWTLEYDQATICRTGPM